MSKYCDLSLHLDDSLLLDARRACSQDDTREGIVRDLLQITVSRTRSGRNEQMVGAHFCRRQGLVILMQADIASDLSTFRQLYFNFDPERFRSARARVIKCTYEGEVAAYRRLNEQIAKEQGFIHTYRRRLSYLQTN